MNTKPGRPKTNFYFGGDFANANLKFVGEGEEHRIPSYRTNDYTVGGAGSVRFEDKGYLVGKAATQSQKFVYATVLDNQAKIENIEILYFGALAHLSHLPSEMTVRMVVSSHAWKTHKEIIKTNLQKQRKVTLAGTDVELTTEVLLVVPEGYGAVYNRQDKCATFDFGCGTTILTTYQNGKVLNSIAAHYGVHDFIKLISSEMKTDNGGYEGDINEIRKSLERGEMKVDGVAISKIYNKCLATWWNDGLSALGKEATGLAKDGYQVISIGGGVALPKFSDVLQKKNFNPITDRPEMVNARGLYRLALINAKQRGYHVTA